MPIFVNVMANLARIAQVDHFSVPLPGMKARGLAALELASFMILECRLQIDAEYIPPTRF